MVTFPTITICNMNQHNKDCLERAENKPMKAHIYRDKIKIEDFWFKEDIDGDPPNETQSRSFDVKNYYRNSGQKIRAC